MKIVMLGNSGVGKTTYMASLYGIMQQQLGGFSLRTENPEDGDRLLKLARNITISTYPSPTSIRNEYDFYLQYQGQDIFPFSWSDYRGAAIRDRTDEEQSQQLIAELQAADGIMLFCDCEALSASKMKAKNEIRRINYLLNQALISIERPISLAIVLTKADKLTRFDEHLFTPFEGTIGTINSSDLVSAAFIPIACGQRFMNVPLPLLVALCSAVFYQAYVAENLVRHHLQVYEELNQDRSLSTALSNAWHGMTGGLTTAQKATVELQKAQDMYRIFEYIKPPVTALLQYLDKVKSIESKYQIADYIAACESNQNYYNLSPSVTRIKQDAFGWF